MFSLTAEEARKQVRPDIILSGGIPATVFGERSSDDGFVRTVRRCLDLRQMSSRLFLAAGDQVPTDAPLHRIEMLPELVEKYGRY